MLHSGLAKHFYTAYLTAVKTLDRDGGHTIYHCIEDLSHLHDLLKTFRFLSHHPLCILSKIVCLVVDDELHNNRRSSKDLGIVAFFCL